MITETYQKTYEGDDLLAAANGVIIFYLLKDAKITSVKVGVREGNAVGDSNFELRQGGTLIANITLGVGVTATTVSGLDFDYLAGTELTLNLLGVNGGSAVTPIYLQIDAVEESGLTEDIASLPVNTAVAKTESYLTRKNDGTLVRTMPLQIKSFFDKSSVPVPIDPGGIVPIADIMPEDDGRILVITNDTDNITAFDIPEGESRYIYIENTGAAVIASANLKISGGSFVRQAGMLFEVVGVGGGVTQLINNNYPQALGDPELVANKTFVKVQDFLKQIDLSAGIGTTSYSGADLVKILIQGAVGVALFFANVLRLYGRTVIIGDGDSLGNDTTINIIDSAGTVGVNAINGFTVNGGELVPKLRPVTDHRGNGDFNATMADSGSIVWMDNGFIFYLVDSASGAVAGETVFYVVFDGTNNANSITAAGSDTIYFTQTVSSNGDVGNHPERLYGQWIHEVRYMGGTIWAGSVLTYN